MRKSCGIVVALILSLTLGACASSGENALNSSSEETGSSETETSETDLHWTTDINEESTIISAENSMNEIEYTTPEGETGFLFIPESVNEQQDNVPMVVMMMCTGGEAKSNAIACGWVDKALEEGIIVLAPNYNNYATYSEIDTIMSSVEYALSQYPVDRSRVYATGFSNGGAMSVALASEKPEYFAAISAYGWMVDMRGQDASGFDMPFQVIQGTDEYTYITDSGAMAIMEDEQLAIRSLFLFNEMIDEEKTADYSQTAYWGYEPEETYAQQKDGKEWQFNNYYKEGYDSPFAQFVLIDGATHQPNENEAEVAWEFMKQFARDDNHMISETNE